MFSYIFFSFFLKFSQLLKIIRVFNSQSLSFSFFMKAGKNFSHQLKTSFSKYNEIHNIFCLFVTNWFELNLIYISHFMINTRDLFFFSEKVFNSLIFNAFDWNTAIDCVIWGWYVWFVWILLFLCIDSMINIFLFWYKFIVFLSIQNVTCYITARFKILFDTYNLFDIIQ